MFYQKRAGSDAWRLQGVLERPQLQAVECELGDAGSLQAAFAACRPQVVLHLAWQGVAGGLRDDAQQAENLVHYRNLLQVAAEYGVEHFIGLGSQAEYGPVETGEAIKESQALKPVTLYGKNKVRACELARLACEKAGMRFSWLRLFSAYGPQETGATLLPYAIKSLLAGERPALTACGQQWDYLYAADAAEALVAVAEKQAAGVFNLGSGHSVSLRRVLEALRDSIDPALPLGFGEKPYPPAPVMFLLADIGALTAASGWQPRTPLAEGIAQTVAWFKLQA